MRITTKKQVNIFSMVADISPPTLKLYLHQLFFDDTEIMSATVGLVFI